MWRVPTYITISKFEQNLDDLLESMEKQEAIQTHPPLEEEKEQKKTEVKVDDLKKEDMENEMNGLFDGIKINKEEEGLKDEKGLKKEEIVKKDLEL